MISKIRDFLKKYNIKNKKVIIGFSSGPDSVMMTFLLLKLKEEFGLEIALAHFNHNWRGQESSDEQEFALKFAKENNLEFYTQTASIDELQTEENARNLRYAFFEKCMEEIKSDIVFLAHNKNDNVETLIYRLIKGTGVAGLCSIPEHRDNYYRPMLDITKEEILSFLNENSISYKIDSSNENEKYKRNLIRKTILPLFEQINPSYLNNISNLIKNASHTRNIVESELNRVKPFVLVDDFINKTEFVKLSKSLRYEILNIFVGSHLKCRNYKNIEKFDDFILNNKTSKISVNRELFLVVKRNKIYFEKHNNYDEVL